MKTLFFILLAFTTFSYSQSKPVNYVGKWMLDMKQSKNLPLFYSNVQSHKLLITQNEKTLKVAVDISDGKEQLPTMNFVYNLDGSESKTETAVKTPNGLMNVPATLKALVTDDGKMRITIAREIKMGDKTFNGTSVEDWQLSADGKTLSIHRADDTPRGKMETDMIFIKD